LVQSRVRCNRVPKKVPEKVWEVLVQSQVRFNKVPKKVPEKIARGFGAEPGQVQQGSGEGSGEGLGGFGAEPGQVHLGSEEVPEKAWEALVQSQVRRLWCRARSGSTGFRRRFRRRPGRLWCRARSGATGFRRKKVPEKVWEALVQSQVRFNRVPEKVPEKAWESLVQSRVMFNRVPEKVRDKVWEALVQTQRLASQHALGRFVK